LYDLACVCCSLKAVDEARGVGAKSMEAGGNEIKLRALDDPDLEQLWKELVQPERCVTCVASVSRQRPFIDASSCGAGTR